MDDFDVLMFVPEDNEFVDLTKYDACDVVNRRVKEIIGTVFVNRETGKEEYVQFRNGKIRGLPWVKKPDINS